MSILQVIVPSARRLALASWALLLLALAPAAAQAQRWALLEDNDGMITHDDKHYTQGFRFSDLLGEPAAGGWTDAGFDLVGRVLPPYRRQLGSRRRIEWIALGQSIFTPEDSERNPPDPKDRPY